jgi:Tfp pilus assembly protein PilV
MDERIMSARRESGFTLGEVVTALFVVGMGILALAPLFVQGAQVTASSDDLSAVSAAAVERLEVLRATGFNSLTAGGSLTSNTTGFFDTSDPEVIVRWTITNNAAPPTLRTITVRALSTESPMGQPKSVELTVMRTR